MSITEQNLPFSEDKLHEQYQHQRLIGEWFSFSDADVEQLSLGMKRRFKV
jgi:hypothetical protein